MIRNQFKGFCAAAGLFFGLLCLTSGSYAQEQITLQQAVDIMLQNNLQIKQAKLTEALSEETVRQSKNAILPTANASTGLNFNFGRNENPLTSEFVNQTVTSSNISVFSSVTLFQGGQRINEIKQNKYFLEADKSNTRKVQNDLSLLVVTTYLQVLNGIDVLEAAKQQLALAEQILGREQILYDEGNKTLADISQAKSQKATADLNVTNAQNQLDLAYLNLAQLLERDPAQRFSVVKPAINEIGKLNTNYSAADVFAKAVTNFPDVSLASFRTLAAKKEIDIAKGNYYPRLSLSAGLGSGYSRLSQLPPGFVNAAYFDQLNENFNQSIGFSLSIPIFNGFNARSTVRRARIGLQNAELNEQLTKNNLNKTVNQAVYDLRAAESRYTSTRQAYESSRDAFNVIQARYNEGFVNSLDLSQAQTNLNKAQFDFIQAQYDAIFRSKVIDFYLGNPLTL